MPYLKLNILILFSLAGLMSFSSCNESGVKKTADSGLDSNTAGGKLGQQIAGDPFNAFLYHERAIYYLDKKDLDNAFADIQKAIKLDSNQAAFYLVSGELYFITGKIKDARKSLETAARLDIKSKEALLKLAQIELYLQNNLKSIALLDKVLRIDLHNKQAYFMKGMNFKEMHDTAKALSSFQTAVEQDPGYYAAYIQLGLIHAKRMNILALEYYKTALRLAPASQEVYYNIGMFYQEAGDYQNAVKYYSELTRLFPGHAGGWFNLGYIHHACIKDYKEARRYYNNALKCDSGFVKARNNLNLLNETLTKNN